MRSFLLGAVLFAFALPLCAQPQAPSTKPAAPAVALPPGAPSLELTNSFFQRLLGYDPNLQVHVVNIAQSPSTDLFDVTTVVVSPEGQQIVHWFVTRDLQRVIAGDLRPFGADPYLHDRQEIAAKAFGPTRGPADAKITIVEFADLECPACREANAVMERLYTDFPNVRFVFQSYPLEQLHPWAGRAASYLDCIARTNNEQAFNFIASIYSHQREIESIVRRTGDDGKTHVDDNEVTGRMKRYSETSGADAAKMQACSATTDTAARIQRSIGLAQSLAITSTPTLYVNGRSVGNPTSVPYETLKAIINFEIDQTAPAK